jgi:hypothetical protein
VRADGVLGRALDRRPRTLPVELLPGRRVTLSEPWKNTPALDSVRVRLTVTAGGGAHGEATATKRFVPWAAVAGACAVILAAGGAAFWFVRRRRHATGGNGENGATGGNDENGANSGNHGSQEIQGSWS